jgi:hypothetical protein
MPRFTSQQLFALRNDIPIRSLIQQVLALSLRQLDGRLRFQCPRCARFHTAIHPTVNLARCFDCRENYNTIELVMAVRHISFLEAAAFLHKHLKKTTTERRPMRENQTTTVLVPRLSQGRATDSTNPTKTPHDKAREIPHGLIRLREILKTI